MKGQTHRNDPWRSKISQRAQQWQEAAVQMQQEMELSDANSDTANHQYQPGGQSTTGEAKVFRRWSRMERLEYRLSKLCFCLLCTVGITHGRNGEIGRSSAQCNPYSSRSLVFHAALHAGHAVQRDSPHTSGERWCPGGPGTLESSCLAPRTDLVDAQRGFVVQELLNFSIKGEIAARMVQFDRDIDRNKKTSGENFPNNIRTGVALRVLPDGLLKQHLVLKCARLTTWETLKAEIDNVRRAQAAASSTPQPMDLSAYGTQGLDAFQKGNPKSRQGQRQKRRKRPTSIFGKTGHWKRDCWHNKANRKPKGKGKDGKGKNPTGTQQQPSGKGKKGVKC